MSSLSTNLKERNMAADFCGYEGNAFESFSSFQAGSSLTAMPSFESFRSFQAGSSFNAMPAFESFSSFQVDQASIQEARDPPDHMSFLFILQEQIKDTIITGDNY